MKRFLLILSIAAGLTTAGCGSGESGHSHGEGADHSHGPDTQQHAPHNETDNPHQHANEEEHGHPHDSTGTTDSTRSQNGEGHSHSREGGHSHERAESVAKLGLDETYDEVRRGVRLTLSYNSANGSFSGTVENTTQEMLPQVSVRVQLSNGTELGLATPVNLDPGESQSIDLDAAGENFESWSAHSEIGVGGHSHGEDGDHEHHN